MSRFLKVRRSWALWGTILAILPVGCTRSLTVTQGDYINTAVHLDRPQDRRTGEPLEIDIVCVTAKDLKNQANELLKPGSGITSDIWFQNRPKSGDTPKTLDRGSRFWIPKAQVHLLTNDEEAYGTIRGAALRGAKNDGTANFAISVSGSGSMFNGCAAVYVFPKFIGPPPERKILPVPPALLDGSRRIKVWWDKDDDRPPHYGQRIEAETVR